MNILDKIVKDKLIEVEAKKKLLPLSFLATSPLMERDTYSMSENIVEGSGIITEFKRRSPSKQVINQTSGIIDVVTGYQKAGASGISVLTDTKYFGGSLDDLIQARSALTIPVLRKEFIIDPYQVYEAKAFGADTILLIAAILTTEEIGILSQLAYQLELEVLLEVHNQEELEKSDLANVQMVGVNNRNLKTFDVSLETSKSLAKLIPEDKVKISESGISSVEAISSLKKYGYKGFLIGENFMKTSDPGAAAKQFLKELNNES
ncbi:indole-3-glycerol phosphate synthase TrpC [Lutimonas saemankumensis]|uniref:indole-3-glycerol phosphate synthase TrpC n=1 Tax=Lutimonas saemankumensis TaxID=483016 RepID=UPI001CD6607D|nr:indole-3-glycerol phosphate synthase TrpC [Lutimonas saemankumensis]MCA0932561.1 indole-3-glycerol phosphate synthase TrpC [Lutimonas saemankumensis]